MIKFNNTFCDDDIIVVDEAFLDKESLELIKKWKTSNENHKKKVFKTTSLSIEEYKELKDILDILKDTDVNYRDYKKAFDKLCAFCHIVPRGVIITKYELKKGDEDKENSSLFVEYSENTKKIKLPAGTKLYHLSKVPGIKKLIPAFKGKSERGYLYDKPRIYFTIRKQMPKFLADYKATDKVHKYECKKDIEDVYVDPLVWSNVQGAVYVELNSPVDVEEVGINKKENESEKEDITNESFDFDDLFGFVSEFGLTIDEN